MTVRRMGITACVLAVLLLAVALVSGSMAESAPDKPVVTEAWVRLPAVPGRPGGGYLTLTGAATPDRLLAVTSPRATRIELHRTIREGAVMRMERQETVSLAARQKLAFAPGGHHLMLFGLDSAIKAGESLPLRFSFERSGTVDVLAVVHGPGGGPDQGHAHQHH